MNNVKLVDRTTFLQNLKISKLLTSQQFRLVVDKVGQVQNTREIAKALVTWKLVTRFQAKMLLMGRNSGFFLGPYRILDVLGQGGMGKVYKAMHQTMNRVVALKILSPQTVKSERAQELFLREVRAAAQLSHPNIVTAYDAGKIEGKHFLAMEYIEGSNLEQYVRANGSLPFGMACEIIFQTANGLQHAFEKGMVHRDIKPANLLFQQEVGTNTVQMKILDFGLARLHQPTMIPADGSMTILTQDHTVMGTPDFLSPEQSKNLHDVDIRADLYSLGCTFYYLLTGKVPFSGGSSTQKMLRHNTELPPELEEVRPDVPTTVAAIVRKLMAKKPVDRFQTPDELMEVLSPHAAPSVMEWPITPPQEFIDRGSDDHAVLPAPQVDTEPRALSPTSQINDAESILEWADANRRQKQRVRYVIYAAVAGALALAAVGGLWLLMR